MDLRKQLTQNRKLRWYEILFAQVKLIQATAREHASGTFPLYLDDAIIYWVRLKRIFNLEGDVKKKIIGVPRKFQTVDGKQRTYYFEELAYKGTAGEAKKHQDKLNAGGIQKSKHLNDIERDSTLKIKHEKELKELLRKARRK